MNKKIKTICLILITISIMVGVIFWILHLRYSLFMPSDWKNHYIRCNYFDGTCRIFEIEDKQ